MQNTKRVEFLCIRFFYGRELIVQKEVQDGIKQQQQISLVKSIIIGERDKGVGEESKGEIGSGQS